MGGSEYLGSYELRGELGRGAMARVWRAYDPNLDREVAIKEPLFDPRLSESVLEEMGRRFVAEGRTAARLAHPGIVACYAADVYDGRPAIVMELVEGATLGQLLECGPLDPQTALFLLDQLLDAVGYAHGHGVVHRDIKPDNIFVTPDGRVKLADFGIAHIDGSTATIGTVAGQVLGSPGYMSPEQATGAPVDARSDLFSVGVVAYEALSGCNPFGAGASDPTTLLYRIVHEAAPELPARASEGLPNDLRPAIMCALSKDPNQRPQSAAAFKAMLHGEAAIPQQTAGWRAMGGINETDTMPPTSAYGFGSAVAPTPAYGSSAASSLGQAASAASKGQRPSWLPYAVVAGVGVFVLSLVLAAALNGPSGSGSAGTGAASQLETVDSIYTVSLHDGRVAIFTNGSSEPSEVSKVRSKYLSDDSRAALKEGIPATSYEEARDILSEYRLEARAEKARREAEKGNTPPVFVTVQASSYLPWDPNDPKYHFEPELAFDGNTDTAWNEGGAGPGTGEWIRASSSSKQLVKGVRIMNGYSYVTSINDLYQLNNRPKQLLVEFSDGSSETIYLKDYGYQWQTFEFSKEHTTTYVKLTIKDVYMGKTTDNFDDACISEIEFY